MNELMIDIGDGGWLYFKTSATTAAEAWLCFRNAIEKAGINDDNVMYTKAILRDAIGKDIDTFRIDWWLSEKKS